MKPVALLLPLLALTAAAPASHANKTAPMLVTAAWLSEHIRDRNLVLLHVGEEDKYTARHIPGARFVDFHAVFHYDSPGGLTLEMPPAESLHARLERLGISDDSRIIVYYGEDWVSPTTRFYFMLDYAGLAGSTSLLDGGMGAWIRAGQATSTEVPAARSGRLSPLRIRSFVVNGEWVRAHATAPGYDLVDARSAGFYDGAMEGGPENAKRRGHIPGAKSLPYDQVVDDSNVFRSATELASLFRTAGVKTGDTVVGYCHIGQQATAMLFAARAIGFEVRLYDGSFEDWARHDWPVDAPTPGRKP
jgi:thiosulfate/3-mercaptopyruvate sulfurtransferase